jgi:hypothetical protein
LRRLSASAAALGLVLVAVLASRTLPSAPPETSPAPGLKIQVEDRNPWTHLRLNNDPATFRFAILADRTNGPRPGVFERAVEQLNWLQPEFVVCVGDLIQGTAEDEATLGRQWRELHGLVARLEMPFFYVPGNHDIRSPLTERLWREQLGRRYYHFVYKGVLFLALSTEDPPRSGGHLSREQLAYVRRVLTQNQDVRWTVVLLHQPAWSYPDVAESGWLEVEEALAGRPYTVFAGHEHRYQRLIRNGRVYYTLATTGGTSGLRGRAYGEFDHVVWVTMKAGGPVVANLLLDGILPEDIRAQGSEVKGVTASRAAR